MLSRIAVVVMALLLVPALPHTAGADPVGMTCTRDGLCFPTVTTPGSGGGGGGTTGGSTGPGGGDSGSSSGSGTVDPCRYSAVSPPPPASDPRWTEAGGTPESGSLVMMMCPGGAGLPLAAPVPTIDYIFVPTGTAPEAVAPDPRVAGQQAVAQLQIPDAVVEVSPTSEIAVNFWLYLWVDGDAPPPATATAGGLSATAQAELVSVTWDMGEPVSASWAESGTPSIWDEPRLDPRYAEQRWPYGCDPLTGSSTVAFTCDRPGVPGDGSRLGPDSRPGGDAVSFMYRWRSDADRTGGTKAWPITATTTWRVTWQASNGFVGAPITITRTSAVFPASVGEWTTARGFCGVVDQGC